MNNDNRNLLVEYQSFDISPLIIKESMEKNDGRLIVSGILQRSGSKNQNGRVYPKAILLREAEKYKKVQIAERRALGELDHPECVTPDTQILTAQGWRFIKDISDDEIVATMNPNTRELEYQKIIRKIERQYTGEMIELKHQSFSACVTPNHRFYVNVKSSDRNLWDFVEAKDLRVSHSIPKKCKWIGVDKDVMELLSRDGKDSLELDMNSFLNFLGWYIAEGWCNTNETRGDNLVSISQKKEDGRKLLDELFDNLPFKLGKDISDIGEHTYRFSNKCIRDYVMKLGKSYDKYIPQEIKNLSPKYLRVLYNSLMNGDGGGQDGTDYYTTSKQLADDMSEIMIKLGYSASITTLPREILYYVVQHKETGKIETIHNATYYSKIKYSVKEDFEIIDKIYQKTDKFLYIVRKKESNYYAIGDMHKTVFDYDGMIYCVEVPNHTIYLMRDGKQFWSGNSSIINLKNVSHNILELWWQNDDLMGKLEVLCDRPGAIGTPAGNILRALFEHGIKVGISSRGLGSVKPLDESGTVEVQSDFDIIAWDCVSSPSTQGAFLNMIKENFDSKHILAINKYFKVQEIINSILRGE